MVASLFLAKMLQFGEDILDFGIHPIEPIIKMLARFRSPPPLLRVDLLSRLTPSFSSSSMIQRLARTGGDAIVTRSIGK